MQLRNFCDLSLRRRVGDGEACAQVDKRVGSRAAREVGRAGRTEHKLGLAGPRAGGQKLRARSWLRFTLGARIRSRVGRQAQRKSGCPKVVIREKGGWSREVEAREETGRLQGLQWGCTRQGTQQERIRLDTQRGGSYPLSASCTRVLYEPPEVAQSAFLSLLYL